MGRRDAGLEDRRPKKEMRDVHCTQYSMRGEIGERRDARKKESGKDKCRKC